MLFGLLRRVFILAPSLVLARPATQSTSSLPPSLSGLIPQCAASCVENALRTGFPEACATSGNLECLCTRYSSSGFTLGEIALGCVSASCQGDIASSTSVFSICLTQQNAVIATHTLLTVTAETPSSTAESTTPKTTPLATTTQTSSSQATTLSTTVTASVAVDTTKPSSQPGGTASVASFQPSAEAVTTSQTASGSSSSMGPLTTGQIIGISVAGAAAVILVVGGIVAITCIQRRRDRMERRRENSGREEKFAFNDAPPAPPSEPMTPPPIYARDQRRGVGIRPVRAPPPVFAPRRQSALGLPKLQISPASVRDGHQLSDEGPSLRRMNPEVPSGRIGIAISPEFEHHQSPDSIQSMGTPSRLLPERPIAPTKPNITTGLAVPPQAQRPDSVASQMTVFEEDARSPEEKGYPIPLPAPLRVPTRAKNIPATRLSPSNANHQTSPPRLNKPQPPPPIITTRQTGSPEPVKQPTLAIRIPNRLPRTPEPPSTIPSPVKVYAPPAYASPQGQAGSLFSNYIGQLSTESVASRSTETSSKKAQQSQGYLPRYYTRNLPEGPDKDSPRLIDIRGPAPKSVAPNSFSRTSTNRSGRDSAASYTTFESVDMDEVTPPDEDDKQLTPVAESPISGLRYPKIPRPSNEAVPRSPAKRPLLEPQRSPQRSPSSLLAKRRGNQAAHDLERRLWVSNSNISTSIYSRTSNMSGYSGQSRAYGHSRSGSDGTIRQHPPNMDPSAQGGPRSAEMAMDLKSPLWAPKITPSRRGDDLFLSVSKIYAE